MSSNDDHVNSENKKDPRQIPCDLPQILTKRRNLPVLRKFCQHIFSSFLSPATGLAFEVDLVSTSFSDLIVRITGTLDEFLKFLTDPKFSDLPYVKLPHLSSPSKRTKLQEEKDKSLSWTITVPLFPQQIQDLEWSDSLSVPMGSLLHSVIKIIESFAEGKDLSKTNLCLAENQSKPHSPLLVFALSSGSSFMEKVFSDSLVQNDLTALKCVFACSLDFKQDIYLHMPPSFCDRYEWDM